MILRSGILFCQTVWWSGKADKSNLFMFNPDKTHSVFMLVESLQWNCIVCMSVPGSMTIMVCYRLRFLVVGFYVLSHTQEFLFAILSSSLIKMEAINTYYCYLHFFLLNTNYCTIYYCSVNSCHGYSRYLRFPQVTAFSLVPHSHMHDRARGTLCCHELSDCFSV